METQELGSVATTPAATPMNAMFERGVRLKRGLDATQDKKERKRLREEASDELLIEYYYRLIIDYVNAQFAKTVPEFEKGEYVVEIGLWKKNMQGEPLWKLFESERWSLQKMFEGALTRMMAESKNPKASFHVRSWTDSYFNKIVDLTFTYRE